MKDAFKQELSYIKSPKIRAFAEALVETIPPYFFRVAASSSGKYHPQYALGEGGLYRHVQACMKIANDILSLEMFSYIDADTRDLILTAILYHDAFKQGSSGTGNTLHNHPIIAADEVRNNPSLAELLPADQREVIAGCIASHMGQWTTSKYSDVVLPTPKKGPQSIVHLVDYLASRRYIEVDIS